MEEPESARAIEDKRLLVLIKASYEDSGRTYGSPRIHRDLKEDGERVGRKRVERVMRENKIRAVRGYKVPRCAAAGPPAAAVENLLERRFTVDRPDQAWVSDITYIRTWESWVYLAVVVDLYSRMVVGWSMKNSATRAVVLDALLMAVMRQQPSGRVGGA